MTVVESVQRVMGWLSETVCPLVSLKLPPQDGGVSAQGYGFETVHPAVLGMYWPAGAQMCPPDVRSPHPGVLVQVVGGEDSHPERRSSLTLRLHLSAWNPGRHGPDAWSPDREAGAFVRSDAGTFQPGYDDGWRDAWNFADTLLRELRAAEDVGGLSVDRSRPVTFGPYEDQGAIVDLYPWWFCHVDVTLVSAEPPAPWQADFL